MQSLQMGGNAPLNSARFEIIVDWPAHVGTLDASAYMLDKTGKVRGDADMIFYNQRSDQSGSLRIGSIDTGCTTFEFDVQAAPAEIERIVICTTVEDPDKTMSAFNGARAQVRINGEVALGFCPDLIQATEVAMQLVEVYRRNGAWKLRAVGQGFNAGLGALARSFGIDVAEDSPVVATTPAISARTPSQSALVEPVIAVRQDAAAAMLNLPPEPVARSLRLDAAKPRHEFTFSPSASLGILTGQLKWSAESAQGRARPLELALGALYRLKDGRDGVVQLCDFVGALDRAPYLQILPDDNPAAGQLSLRVNGDHAQSLARCALFAYIPRGPANWRCKSIDFSFGGQNGVVVDLPQGGDGQGVMGIAMLDFGLNSLVIERIGQFFSTHRHLSEELGWKLRWRSPRVA